MKSPARGKSTSVLVQGVDKHGVWIFIKGKEYFLPYQTYPWFKNARPSQIQNVKMANGHHLYWPALDVDLELDAVKHPEKYPLTYR